MQEEVLSLLENHLLKKLQTLEKSLKPFVLYFTVPVVSFSEPKRTNIRGQSINGNLFQNIPTVIRVL
jgi:hypothetical protein